MTCLPVYPSLFIPKRLSAAQTTLLQQAFVAEKAPSAKSLRFDRRDKKQLFATESLSGYLYTYIQTNNTFLNLQYYAPTITTKDTQAAAFAGTCMQLDGVECNWVSHACLSMCRSQSL
jgi:hypothetical protein